MARCDPAGVFVQVNAAFTRLIGRTEAELLGTNRKEVTHPDDLPREREVVGAMLENKGDSSMLEKRYLRPDGSIVWADVSLFPVRGADGEMESLMAIIIDKTAAKRAEEKLWQAVAESQRAEQELRRAHQREQLILQQSRLAVIEWDLDFRVTRWNLAAEKMFGHTAAEAIGRPATFIVPADERSRIAELWAKLMAKDPGGRCTNDNVRKDGARITCEWINTPLTDQEGQVYGAASLVLDVTEQRRAQERLSDSEALYHSLVENLPQNIFRKDIFGRFTFANHRFCEMVRRPLDQVLGKTDADLFPAELAQKFQADDRRVIALGEPLELIEENVSASGERLTVQVVKTPLRDARGHIIGVQGIFWDISTRKEVEEALRRSRADLELAQAIGHVGSWVSEISPAGKLDWSAETCRIFGILPGQFDGRIETFFRMLHPDDVEEVRARSTVARSGGQPFFVEHRIVRPDGTVRWVRERAELERDKAGNPWRMIGVVQDITENRLLEEHLRQAQKLESVGQLAAGVAHDFNNILTVINGNAALLLNGLIKPENMELLREIISAGDRASNLTRQLLLFSRKQRMQLQTVDLNELTGNLTKMLGRLLGEDILLEYSHAAGLPTINADPGMIEQVIMNLAVNSRDAMPKGGRLHIATSLCQVTPDHVLQFPKSTPGPHVCLAVTDTGCGIPAHLQDRVFEPFFTTKDVGKGTGLGLATVYGIVEQHGGWVELESAPGQGAQFRIYLPVTSGKSASANQPSRSAEARSGGEHILVVEDEPAVRELVRRILERQGYRISAAASGVEALKLAPELIRDIDLLVTDMVMPEGVSGRELAEQMRRDHDPNLRVLYCTGYSPDAAGDGLELREGINFLQKPFTPAALVNAVANCFAPRA